MLNRLRRVELSNICRKLGIQVSGVKNELIDRLLEWAAEKFSASTATANDETLNLTSKGKEHKEKTPDVGKLKDPGAEPMDISGLDEVKRNFPGLEPDEQSIVALIKEAKSLTEQDIERASRHHAFEWFLTRAHMAELLAKLKKIGNPPIRIRGVRSVNIYEWSEVTGSRKGKLINVGHGMLSMPFARVLCRIKVSICWWSDRNPPGTT